MKSAIEQLSRYKSVHLNKNNIKTHFIGIPLIIWSVFVFFSLIRLPIDISNDFGLSFATLFACLVLVYYFLLHSKLALGLFAFIIPVLFTSELMASNPDAIWIGLAAFIVGWLFQMLGHHYEKAKPAFVDDLNQLLIGPFFLMAEVYFMLGGLKELEKEITAEAIKKRRELEAKRNSVNAK